MLDELKYRLGEWLRIRRDAQMLRRLDDHLLADLGLTRRDIIGFVRGKARLWPRR